MAELEASLSRAPSAASRSARTAPLAGAAKFAARFGLFLLLSSGLFYFAYKFYQPAHGGTDYFQYYQTYLRPLDMHVAKSPYVYRQLSAVITNLIYRFGPYYHPQIFYAQAGYDQRMFFAALLTNYLALGGAAAVTANTVERLRPRGGPAVPLLAGALCYLSFFAQENGIGPITDGMAWLLVAVGLRGYVSRSLVTVGIVLALSIVERETIPVMIGAIAAAHLTLTREQRRFDIVVIVLCGVALALYFGMRLVWAPVAGHENQTDLAESLAHWRPLLFSKEVIFQGYLSQNLLILLGLVLVWRWMQRGRAPPLSPEVTRLIVGLFVAAAVLVFTGFTAKIGQNVGRVLAMLTPVAASLLALALIPDDRSRAAAGAATAAP